MLAPVQPKSLCRSSLSRFILSSPSRADMLCNPSHHVLLTYKTCKKELLGYLQSSASTDSPHRDALYSGIFCTKVVLGYLVD